MPTHECPLCGKQLIENEKFCRDCQEIAVNRFSPHLLNHSESETTSESLDNPIVAKKQITGDSELVEKPKPKKRGRPRKVIEEIELPVEIDLEPIPIPDEMVEEVQPIEELHEELPASLLPKEEIMEELETLADENNYNGSYHSSKKLALSIIAASILGITAGGMGVYMYTEPKPDSSTVVEQQDAFWLRTITENSHEAYSEYLTDYPQGKYAGQAVAKINNFENKDTKAWVELQKLDNLYSYLIYLAQNPNSKYELELNTKIDSLSWVDAQKQHTADSYLFYLANSKQGSILGRYAPKAEEQYTNLTQIITVEGDEAAMVMKVVNRFFKNLSDNNFREVENLMNPTLNSFFDQRSKTSKEIVEWLKADLRNNQIRYNTYVIDKESSKISKDSKPVYRLSILIEKRTIYENNKKEVKKMTLLLELNAKKQIESILVEQ